MLEPATLQQTLLALICYDANVCVTLAFRLDPKLFLGRANKLIAETAISYIKQYKAPPGQQLEFILEPQLRRGEDGKYLGQTIDILQEQYKEGIDPAFIIAELDNFEQAQRLTTAAQDALELVARGELEEAKRKLLSSQPIPQNVTSGIWLDNPRGMFRFADRTEADFFSSGIEAIDRSGATPERKTVTFMIASKGRGKSWFLINVAKAGIQYHHPTLILTFELSEEQYAKRLLQAIFALTVQDVESITVPTFESGKVEFRDIVRGSLLSKRPEIEQRLEDMISAPPLLIKEFPTASFSTEDFDLYLDQLEREYGFKPDLTVLDMPELMKVDPKNLRLDTGRLWRDIRGTSVRRNMAIVAASQGNRESEDATVVKATHAAEDWSKLGTADNVYTFSQTQAEYKLGLSRIWVDKARYNARDRFMVLNSQAYSIGQFSLESIPFSRDLDQQTKVLTSAGTAPTPTAAQKTN